MRPFVIKNVKIVLETKTINLGYLLIRDGVIAEVGEQPVPEALAALQTLDGEGMFLCPGFVDLHTHGGGDHDLRMVRPMIFSALRAHLAHGTTTIAPTTLTSSDEELSAFFENYEIALQEKENMPHLAGFHLEGPYFSARAGGRSAAGIPRRPEKEHYTEILRRSNGHMLRWSIAPELDGAMALGDELKARGIIASIGHSNADYETVKESLKHGFTHVTHLYSGMSTITRRMGHRVLGVVGARTCLTSWMWRSLPTAFICRPNCFASSLKRKTTARFLWSRTAWSGAGMPEGPSILGSQPRHAGDDFGQHRQYAGSFRLLPEASRRRIGSFERWCRKPACRCMKRSTWRPCIRRG